MLKGHCLCGAIQYEYHAALEQSILCYCRDCQQAQDGIMAWNSPIQKNFFKIIQGEDLLSAYFHTPNKARVFCRVCASPIYSYRIDLPQIIRLRLGTVVEGDIPAPTEIFYAEAKPEFDL